MIFNTKPQSWQELQSFVGQLFQEIGYSVEVSKVVELARGKKEIDVYVQDILSEYQPIFLIECKYWNKPVSQETIHAFHTVINDFGANFGFIVSRNGFQSGCYEAAEKTNIRLVSLEELEAKYHGKWQSGMVSKYLPLADQLFPYWDPVGGKMPRDGLKISWKTQILLRSAYLPLVRLGNWDLHGKMKRDYPLTLPVLDDDFELIGEIIINNDRDYFDFIEANKDRAFYHFKKLFYEVV